MFILKKVITSVLVPPGAFVIILLLTGLWLWRRKQRRVACINFALALLIWALSISPVSNALTSRLEAGLTIPAHVQGDVIILLGGGMYEGVTDLTGRGAPSEDTLARTVTAARLQRQLRIPVIISGGSGFEGRLSEAPVIRRFLLDLGVEEHQVLVESLSRDTRENALYCSDILKTHGFRQPLLVTSAYHMRRSIKMFQRVGVKITPIPAQFMTHEDLPFVWVDLLPRAHALQQTEKALKEYLGLLYSVLT